MKQRSQKEYADRRRATRSRSFHAGDWVRVKKPGVLRKGEPQFSKPIQVLQRIGKTLYLTSDSRRWHINRLASAVVNQPASAVPIKGQQTNCELLDFELGRRLDSGFLTDNNSSNLDLVIPPGTSLHEHVPSTSSSVTVPLSTSKESISTPQPLTSTDHEPSASSSTRNNTSSEQNSNLPSSSGTNHRSSLRNKRRLADSDATQLEDAGQGRRLRQRPLWMKDYVVEFGEGDQTMQDVENQSEDSDDSL